MMLFAAEIRRKLLGSKSWGKGTNLKATLALGVLAVTSAASGQVSETPLASYNSLGNLLLCGMPYSSPWHTTLVSVLNGGLVSFNLAYTTASIKFPNVNNLDFSTAGAIALDVTNTSSGPLSFKYTVHDSSGGLIQNIFTVPGNATTTCALLLGATSTPSQFGVVSIPSPYPGYNCMPGYPGEAANLKSITDIMLTPSGRYPGSTFVLSNIRLLQGFNWNTLMTGAIDPFGQSAITNWAGKLTSASQFATRRAAEEASFSNLLGGTVDKYGGSLSLPAQTATGHFYTKQVNGKWWLVDPIGNLYWMNGIDEVNASASNTLVSGRQSMFQSLPASTDPLAANYGTTSAGGTTYNFYQANLQQKYGANWNQNWLSTIVSRMQTWGLNAFGSFTDNSVNSTKSFPYLYETDVVGNFNTVSTGSDLWAPMPDAYDPAWAAAVTTKMTSLANQMNNDPYMIGVVFGNELSWTGSTGTATDPYALGLGALAQTASASPSKQFFLTTLAKEYSSNIASLNAAWGTSYTSWSDLNSPLTFGSTLTTGLQNDINHFIASFAWTYYHTIRQALKKVAPNTLYFGNAYSTTHMTESIVWEATYSVDVISFNMYGTTMLPAVLQASYGVTLPQVITEFNFSSISDGLWGGFIPEPNDSSRAAAYSSYMNMILTNSNFIGGNFFLYEDQPTSGIPQGGGQNNSQGLLDVTDTPYASMVSAVQAVAKSLYSTRWGS